MRRSFPAAVWGERILLKLLDNALKFSNQDQPMSVKASHQPGSQWSPSS